MKREKEVKKKKTALTFSERLVLSSILPTEGNIINMVLGKTLVAKVQPTPAEIKKSGMNQEENGVVSFKNVSLKDVSFAFEDAEITFLKEQANRLDKANKVTFQNLSLCEKLKNL